MKANELRIGNYVDVYGEPTVINGIEWDNGWWFDFLGTDICYDGEIKPIPLTEQWLKDFGFACNKYGCTKDRIQVKLMNGFAIIYLRNIVNLETDIYTDWMWIAKIRYVHELQNLYFALIGEELTKTSKNTNAEK